MYNRRESSITYYQITTMPGGNTGNGFDKRKEDINRNGAPKKEWTWAGVLKRLAEEEQASGTHLKDLMGKALIKEALKGNVAAIKEFGDRIDGKPKQTIDVNDTSIDDIINDL